MKIVQINETCGTGSIGRTTLEMATDLEQRGHECLVLYAGKTLSEHNSVKIGTNIDHKFHATMSRITGMQGYFSIRATKAALKEIERFKPDIVHIRNLHSNYINLKLLLGFLAYNKIPTVITLHDCWLYTGKCTYYIPGNCDKWKNECGECPLLHIDNMNPTWFFDRTKKCLNDKKKWFNSISYLATIGVSQWVANEAKKSILGDTNPIAIYNWIDSDVFFPKDTKRIIKNHCLEGKFVVLMVTTFIRRAKGYDVLVGLSKSLGSEYKIIAVGKNSENLNIPSNVIHIPYTNDTSELAEYYSVADVCVNTTKFETFGKVTAEALCCGTPVIVYNNTASPELVGDGCGYVVEEKDGINSIVNAIYKICKNGKQVYTDKCVAFATDKFSKEGCINQYLDVYEELISRKKKVEA